MSMLLDSVERGGFMAALRIRFLPVHPYKSAISGILQASKTGNGCFSDLFVFPQQFGLSRLPGTKYFPLRLH